MTGATIRGNWREFLHDDRKNCYLFAWSVRWWLNLGYTLEEIAQVHLFGHYAVTVDGRWSDRYNDLIFGKTRHWGVEWVTQGGEGLSEA